MPIRIFTPQVLAPTGAKLSNSPLATRDEQLANIRQIYAPEREALGVVALGIELVDPPRIA